MKDEGAGNGRQQKVQSPGIRVIRMEVCELGETISALTLEQVRKTMGVCELDKTISTLSPGRLREMARMDREKCLMFLQNGRLGGRFYGLVSKIDPDHFAPVTICSLSNLFIDRVLVPFGCLERRLGGDGTLTRQWSEEVVLLGFSSESDDDKKKCEAFVRRVAELVDRKMAKFAEEEESQAALVGG